MKYLFIVQGEGRGHMTQSVAMSEILREQGHQVTGVLVGRSRHRRLPGFYKKHFDRKLKGFRSPNFIRNADGKGINVFLSILFNVFAAPLFLAEVIRLAFIIRRTEAQAIINFYDMIGSLAHVLSFSGKKMTVISHHFFFDHPEFSKPSGHNVSAWLLSLHSGIVSFSASRKIALSFTRPASAGKDLSVAPPLLRKQIRHARAKGGGYFLVYLLNEGFLDLIYEIARHHEEAGWHIYTDCSDHAVKHLPNVKLLPPSGEDFIDDLAGCRAVICTAGFETVCEAAYLGKPVRLIPSTGHYEQLCNLADAERAGVAKAFSDTENFTSLIPGGRNSKPDFRDWVELAEAIFTALLDG